MLFIFRVPKQDWKWGDLHTATFRNSTFGRSGIAPIEALFNRGPVAITGTSDVINASNWPSSNKDAGNRTIYQDVSAASTRMVLDVSDFDNSIAMHSTRRCRSSRTIAEYARAGGVPELPRAPGPH